MSVVKKHVNPYTRKPGECVAQHKCEFEGSPHFFWDTVNNHAVLPPDSEKQTELNNTPVETLHEQHSLIARTPEQLTKLDELYNKYVSDKTVYTELMEAAQKAHPVKAHFVEQVKTQPNVIGGLDIEVPTYKTTARDVPGKTAAKVARAYMDTGKDERTYRAFISSCFVS